MTLEQLRDNWQDVPAFHQSIHEHFTTLVNADPQLDAHRTYVESKVFGMGERSFWWLWKLLLETLPENPKLLEVGVFKAATMSLWKMLRPDATCYGVTPLDGRGTGWTEDDYFAHITKIHHDFGLEMPYICPESSHSEKASIWTNLTKPYDVVYLDGDHSHEGTFQDLKDYAPMVKSGGWLIIDDAACRTSQPFGYFQGIDTVCSALEEWEKDQTEFVFQFNVVHLMCYRRK